MKNGAIFWHLRLFGFALKIDKRWIGLSSFGICLHSIESVLQHIAKDDLTRETERNRYKNTKPERKRIILIWTS